MEWEYGDMRKRIISGLLSALLILQTVSTPVYATNGSIVVDEVVTTAEELIEESEEVVEETSQEESSVVESAGEESSEEEMDTFERESNEEEQKEMDLLEESIIDESFSEENKEIGTKDMREEVSVSEETNPTLGICGDNLIWELENNILTISGTGAMYDFDGNISAYKFDVVNIDDNFVEYKLLLFQKKQV